MGRELFDDGLIIWLEPNGYQNLTVEGANHMGKLLTLVYDSISSTTITFTTETYQYTFKIQKGTLTCDSAEVLYLLKCKVCGEIPKFPMLGKQKIEFGYRFNSYKSKHREREDI